MGRMEGLIGLALGRSPYEEQVVSPSIGQEGSNMLQNGQRYDDHGRPINPETRQRMRDHVRASNEVMQAAGIIEETADVRARDKALKEAVDRETDMGLRRLEVGRVLLVAGVWGVCGFRRRILLYKSYSSGLLDILRYEKTQYSMLHIAGAGLPALIVQQCIEWLGLISRAMISEPNDSTKLTSRPKSEYRTRMLRRVLNYGFGYVVLNYQMFAIIQQLNMWPTNGILPSLKSLIPFSAYSPLRLPPLPSSASAEALSSWATALFLNLSPLGLVLIHSFAFSMVSARLYSPVYRSLPRPVNPEGHFAGILLDSTEANTETDYDAPNSENRDPAAIANGNQTAPRTPAVPSHHTATLQALEGRPPNRDDSSDDEDHEMSQQTLITFDVEATEMTEAAMGTWSAELRSANEPPPKETIYRMTALTMLPPLLAAEGLSNILTELGLLSLEALMVRTVARGYRLSAGLGTNDLFSGISIPWQALINIFAVDAVELAVMGAAWAAITIGSQGVDGKYFFWSSVVEADNGG